ncbi:MAG: efflux RND transporter periplasmic adaptor subunit [Candidatus Cloacimonadota bacterium]|nr:MAG: efflux RND transporter periplasmic adaptor subunit [Candidatus Cloacimonadota bacterium]
MKKKIIIGVGILVVILIIVVMNVKFKGKAIEVKAEKVKKGEIKSIVSAPGRVSPKNDVNISSDIMGKLIKLNVREGDKVKRGDVISELDRTREEAAVEVARSSLLSAKASYEMKSTSFERTKKLYEKLLISKEEFEVGKTDFRMAELTVEERQANLKNALENLNKTIIKSPINGVVTRLNVEEGETVVTGTMNNPGTVLMVLSDLSQMEIECEVDESDIVDLEIEQFAEINVDAFGDTIFEGHVVEISNAGRTSGMGTQEEVTNFKVKVAFDKTDSRLRPGMSSSVDIISSRRDSVLKVPIQCVIERGEEEEKKTGIFVVVDGKAHFREVKTGISSETEIEIKEGVEEEEMVVSGPYSVLSKLEDGDDVKTKKPSRKKGKGKKGKDEEEKSGKSSGGRRKKVKIGG